MSIKDLGDLTQIESNKITNFNSVGSITLGDVNETANVKIILEKRNKSVTGILSFPTTGLKMQEADSKEQYIEFIPENNIPTAYIPKKINDNQLSTILRGGSLTITTSDETPVTSYVSCLLLYNYTKARFVVGLNNRNVDDVNFIDGLTYKMLGPMTFTYLVD